LLWKITGPGEGYSTPSVAAGKLFVMGNVQGDGQRRKTECILAFDADSGKQLWKCDVGPERAGGGGYSGPRSTPTVRGDRLYALGLNGDLVCASTTDGKIVWRRNLASEFGGSPGGWGYSESPLLDGDRVLCTPGGRRATLAALDASTGKTIWQAAVPEGDAAAYASIIAADIEGQRQYVQVLAGGVVGVSADGKFLWRYNKPANGTANCSTAIHHDGQVFAASDYGTGGGLVKLTRQGNAWSAKEIYFTRDMRNHHGGMVLIDGHVYGDNGGQLTCIEFATGKVKWKSRQAGKGSIACADGRLYYREEQERILLVEANPDAYVETGRFDQPNRSGQPTWPHPVIANGKLYIRDQNTLLCYDVKAP
jgi:outer membrane protein assembly factor BamB